MFENRLKASTRMGGATGCHPPVKPRVWPTG